jgi:hypothetical protein
METDPVTKEHAVKLLPFLIAASLVAVAGPASAIQVVGEPKGLTARAFETTDDSREGVVQEVDLKTHSLIVGGQGYLFPAALVPVHGGSPLTLKQGSRIRFTVKKEGAQERITEIWVMAAH